MIGALVSNVLKKRPLFRRIVSNTAWLFADKVIRLGVGVVVSVWVARYLGPERFGLFNYAIAFVSLFTIASTLGCENILIRELVRRPDQRRELLGTVFTLRLSASVVTASLSVATIFFIPAEEPLARWLVAILAGGVIFSSADVIDQWFQSQIQSKYAVFARNTAFLLTAGFRILLIQVHAPLIAFAWANFLEAALAAAGLATIYVRRGHSMRAWRFRWPEGVFLLRESWPLILANLAIITYLRIDQIMLKEMLSESAVGIYSAAQRLSEVWYFIAMAINASVFPAIVALLATSRDACYRRLFDLFSLMSALAVTIAIPLTFLSGPLIHLVYGRQYAGAGPVLAVHIWAALFVFWGVVGDSWFLAEGLVRFLLLKTVAGAVIKVGLNLLLLRRFGPVGAASATVFTQGLVAWLANAPLVRTRPIFVLQIKSLAFPVYIREIAGFARVYSNVEPPGGEHTSGANKREG
jgi:PST family polysaccharide transporter